MNSISPYLSQNASYYTPAAKQDESDAGSINASFASRVRTSVQQNSDLTLVTEDGDKITISSAADDNSLYTSYDKFGMTQDSLYSLSGETGVSESSNAFNITIEGDLSEDELKDLGSALSMMDSAMRNLVNGNIDDAVQSALGLSDLESIAGFEASLEVNRTVSVENYMEIETEGSYAADDSNDMIGQTKELMGSLADKIADIFDSAGEPRANAANPVSSIFEKLFEDFASVEESLQPSGNSSIFDAARKIYDDIMERISQY